MNLENAYGGSFRRSSLSESNSKKVDFYIEIEFFYLKLIKSEFLLKLGVGSVVVSGHWPNLNGGTVTGGRPIRLVMF